jgi:hypothetical protein
MNNKVIIFGIISAVSTLIGYMASQNNTPGIRVSNYSTLEEAKKASVTNDFMSPTVLFASQVKKDTINKEKKLLKSPLLKESYYKNFSLGATELGKSLELLENEHEILLQNMRKEGVKIDAVTSLKPRLNIAITLYLGLSLGELTSDDVQKLKLSNREWYVLKTFSESKDFAIMLKRDSLTSEFLQIENLTNYYQKTAQL